MIPIKNLFLIYFLFLITNQIKADHHLSGEIIANSLDSLHNTMDIFIRLDRHCNSTSYPSNITFYILQNADPLHPEVYTQTALTAILESRQKISLNCDTSQQCNSQNAIERSIYKAKVILSNPNLPVLVYYKGSYRITATNLYSNQAEFLIYNQFLPNYLNQNVEISQKSLEQGLNFEKNQVFLNSSDIENDSVKVNVQAPLSALNPTLNPFSYTITPCQLALTLTNSRPFFVSESSIPVHDLSYSYTPSQNQQSNYGLLIKEYRLISFAAKDSWVCISTRNQEQFIKTTSFSSMMDSFKVTSNKSLVHIDSNQIILCNDGSPTNLQLRVLKRKSTEVKDLQSFWQSTRVTQPITQTIASGALYDTVIINFTYNPKNVNNSDYLIFQFSNCFTTPGNQISFNKVITLKISEINYRIFAQDTFLNCDNIATIPLLNSNITTSLGLINNSNPLNPLLVISNPRDTMIYGYLQNSSSYCPNVDSIYLNQGSVYSIQHSQTNPTCFGYNDGTIQTNVIGTNSPYKYQWSNGETTSNLSSLIATSYYLTVLDKDRCPQYDTIVLSQPIGVDAQWIMDTPITCYGLSNGYGHFKIQGSLYPANYNWNHSTSQDSFMGSLHNGFYNGSFLYTNLLNHSCQQAFTIYIPQPDTIEFTTIKYDATCFNQKNGKIAFIAKGGVPTYTYHLDTLNQWYQNIFNSLGAKTYKAYVIDNNACSSDTISITIGSPLPISSSINTVSSSCKESKNGQINIQSIQGGVSPYLITINQGLPSSTQVYSGLETGNYSIRITDQNNCFWDSTVSIGVSYKLAGSVSSILPSICPNSNTGKATITLNNNQIPFTAYSTFKVTTHNSNLFVIDSLKRGANQLTIFDRNNCLWDTLISINEPDGFSSIIKTSAPTCYNGSNGTITISNIMGGTSPYQSPIWFNNGQFYNHSKGFYPDTYQFKIIDANLCEYSQRVVVGNTPPFLTKLYQVKPITCFNGNNGSIQAVTQGINSPFLYSWDNSTNTQNNLKEDINSGWHKVIVTDQKNCQTTDSIFVTNPDQIAINNLKIQLPECPYSLDGKLSLIPAGGNGEPYTTSIHGTNFSTTTSYSQLAPGNYNLIVRDRYNCEVSMPINLESKKNMSVSLSQAIDTLELGSQISLNPIIQYGTNTQSQDITSILWTPSAGLSCDNCLQPTFTATHNMTYKLFLNYGASCIDTQSISFVIKNPLDPFIPTAFSPNGDSKNDVWRVYGNQIKDFQVKVLDRYGELVYSSQDIRQAWDGTFKGSFVPLSTYNYYVKVSYLNNETREYKGMITVTR